MTSRARGSAPVTAMSAAARVAARRRARVLTVLLGLTGAAWIASVFVTVAWPVAIAVSGLLALDVVALVVGARRRAVRRAVAARALRREAERHRAVSERRQRATPGAAGTVASAGQVTASQRGAPVEARQADVPEAPAERVARELVDGGTPWTPVPVPPPTYTLKPTAPRPEPAPLDLPPAPQPPTQAQGGEAEAPAARTPRPWDADRTFADDLDLDAVLARRRAVNG